VETPRDVVADINGPSIVLSRTSKKDRVPGAWIKGKNKAARVAIVVDPNGSSAAMETEIVKRLAGEGRTALLLDAFQTGAARAPRSGDLAVEPMPKLGEDADEEARADAAAGFGKFLTFNVSVDAARVQDILTAIAHAHQSDVGVDLYASGDAALWATFAAAVSDIPVSLHLGNIPEVNSNSDYVRHFNVPGILRAGGLQVARNLADQH